MRVFNTYGPACSFNILTASFRVFSQYPESSAGTLEEERYRSCWSYSEYGGGFPWGYVEP